MEQLNEKFDTILKTKGEELLTLSQKKIKNRNVDIDKLPYGTQTTMFKIQAEQERKLKTSKAYKNKEQLFES